MGIECVIDAKPSLGLAPTLCVGELGVISSGWADSICCNSFNNKSSYIRNVKILRTNKV